jgi:pentatricopeptide repeat protein
VLVKLLIFFVECLELMKNDRIAGTIPIFNTVITILCEAQLRDKAVLVLDWMQDSGVPPDVNSYKTLIKHLTLYGQQEGWNLAMELWKRMRREDLKPLSISVLTLLGRSAMYQEWEKTFSLIEGMKKDQTVMLLHDWNTFLWEAGKHINKCKKYELVDKLLGSMAGINLKADALSYRIISDMYANVGMCDEAIKYLIIAKDKNLPIDYSNFDGILLSFVKRGKFKDAMKLVELMWQYKVAPGVRTYALIVGGLKKVGQIEMAALVGEKMVACGMKENQVVANTQAQIYASEFDIPEPDLPDMDYVYGLYVAEPQ